MSVTPCRILTLLLTRLLIDNLDLIPLSVGVLTVDADLVVTTRDGKHVADLTPADFPQRHAIKTNLLLQGPLERLAFLLIALAHPHFAGGILRATRDHFMHEANIWAPGHVAYPVTMAANGDDLGLLLPILQLPQLDFVVVATRDEAFGWGLEFATCRRYTR